MANVTKYIDKLSFPSGSDTITANLVDTVSGYTANTGTVTSVAISGTSPISASGTVTTSGTLSVSHEASGVTAKTTAALYPFKVNDTGHITEVGTAVTVPTIITKSVTIPTASWTGSDPYTNTVTVSDILASDYPLVQADITTNAEKNAWECIVRGEASANAITFTALNSYPTIDLTATVMVIR